MKGENGMNWNKDKSIILTQACLIVFAVCLFALDVGMYWVARWTSETRVIHFALLMVSGYGISVFAWIVLWRLWRFMANIKRGVIFTKENYMHCFHISWCMVGAAIICFVCGLFYFPFLVLFAASGFVAIMMRVVKNVFQQAVEMRSELDLTI